MIRFMVEVEYVAEGLTVQIKPRHEGNLSGVETIMGAMIGESLHKAVTEVTTKLQKFGGGKLITAKGESANTMAKIEEKRRREYEDRNNTDQR